ncbi:Uu.00g041760.m01.CDS01 [Anthostomella pinea]|uniref:Uu.00g041760.m01.CDS01 n=1 Tax=Anthostomella pinea TaxID=933095 RepID=A0AAI8V5G8_9PEZI|nr:Uu.00g041760.m01.CDS01 [Anthostomella pinea]
MDYILRELNKIMPAELQNTILEVAISGEELRPKILQFEASKNGEVEVVNQHQMLVKMALDSTFSTLSNGQVMSTDDVLYFNAVLLKDLDFHQLGGLKPFFTAEVVAIDWRALQTYAGIKETLTLLFSHLRNIELIIVAVPQSSKKASQRNKEVAQKCHQEHELSLVRLSNKTVLRFEGTLVNWSVLGKAIHDTMRGCTEEGDAKEDYEEENFWDTAEKTYGNNQILALPPRPMMPEIILCGVARGCCHEKRLCAPRVSADVQDGLFPGDEAIEKLINPTE